MTLIEGVGDEVTEFFILIVIILIGLTAWWSTSIVDQPLIRTVLILERRTRHRVAVEPPAATSVAGSSHDNSIDTGQLESQTASGEIQQEVESGAACQVHDKETAKKISSPATPAASSSQNCNNDQSWEVPEESNENINEHSNTSEYFQACTSPLSPRINGNSLIEGGDQIDVSFSSDVRDTDSDLLRSRRIAFFQSRQVTLLDSPVTDGPQLSSSSSVDNDNIDATHSSNRGDDLLDNQDGSSATAGSIRIRLKYLNDDQKLVEGRLQEQLGDFKKRHFGLELATDKLVRLIFNGQVLQSDNETLQGYGLFDNCVVHCLVHQQRSGSTNQAGARENQSGRDSAASNAADGAPHRDWDLGNVLFASLSLFVGSCMVLSLSVCPTVQCYYYCCFSRPYRNPDRISCWYLPSRPRWHQAINLDLTCRFLLSYLHNLLADYKTYTIIGYLAMFRVFAFVNR